jgi:hypothetical protein
MTLPPLVFPRWGDQLSPKISKVQNRLLMVCYVPATNAGLSRLLFLFLQWPFIVLMKQTRQAVHTFKQSILLRCLWLSQKIKLSTIWMKEIQIQAVLKLPLS